MKTIDVVAAVITNQNKEVLIARRRKGKSLEGFWEFPGGKVEIHESHQEALNRELQEEFSIQTEIGAFITSNMHDYGTIKINLYAYHVNYISGHFALVDHDKIDWANIPKLTEYHLAPADIPIVYFLINDNNYS